MTKEQKLWFMKQKNEQFKHYQYLIKAMIDHALLCREGWCWCKASTFRYGIAELKQYEDKSVQKLIDEVFEV